MDDYQEYVRMAKLMSKIHAKPPKVKKLETDCIENNNSFSNDSTENKETEEETFDEKHNLKQSNLDVSMEEEEKEPLQNSSHNHSNQIKERRTLSRFGSNKIGFSEDQNLDISSKNSDLKAAASAKGVLSGSSLFGGKCNPAAKTKKKKVRRI